MPTHKILIDGEYSVDKGDIIEMPYSNQVVCYDCDLSYCSPAWADVVVPDDIWEQISPTKNSGGLLCFNCINDRLNRLKLQNVPFKITSGAFAFMIRENNEQ